MTATLNDITIDEQVVSEEARSARAVLGRLATRAMGLTGADIERIVRQARLKARREKRSIRYEDIEEGIRLGRSLVPYDLRWRFAVHEAGHAVVHHALDLGPIHGLNIDTGQGGYNLLGLHSSGTDTLEWYEDMLTMLMAGRAAENIVLGRVSGGSGGSADSDLGRATSMAFDMERSLGFAVEHPLLYRPHRNPGDVLDRHPKLADRIHGRLEAALERAAAILRERKEVFEVLIRALFDAQALDGDQLMLILDPDSRAID
jgi:cell division protease FtsH